MCDITILTPTYNREDKLKVCYENLLKQTEQDFRWLIVDDGSVDNTKKLVESFVAKNEIKIEYIYKSNGGKHTAVNIGVRKINTELTIILDSDDYLTDDAIQQIKIYHNKYENIENLCGYSFLKLFSNGKINGKLFPKDEEINNFINSRINGKIPGDKCEVFYTKCLKEYAFPEFEGEKFLGESTVWVPMGLKYDMVHINKGIYIGDYLNDGLTQQGRRMRIRCPKGGMKNAEVHMIKQCNMKQRLKSSILYNCYSYFDEKSVTEVFKETEYKILTMIGRPLGYILYRYWSIKYITN